MTLVVPIRCGQLVLPAEFKTAHVSGDRRSITCRVTAPEGGAKYRSCAFVHLEIEAKEDRPFEGEVWWYISRIIEGWNRISMSEVAGKALKHELAVALQAYGGFDRAWEDARGGSTGYYTSADALKELEATTRRARWWQSCVEARQLIEAAPADLVTHLYDPEPLGKHPRRYSAPASGHASRDTEWLSIPTRLQLLGEQVAWLTSDGVVVPLDDLEALKRKERPHEDHPTDR